jgi:hypothetical protein
VKGMVTFAHLDRLSDDRGLFEHALGVVRREEHGYCTDDNARLLVVASLERDCSVADRLSRVALGFVLSSQDVDGKVRNRMDVSGRWLDNGTTEDCWGRAMWGLGIAAAAHPDDAIRLRARKGFNHGARQRSRWPRAMAFAALGAAAIADVHEDHELARKLLADAIAVIAGAAAGGARFAATDHWQWPEPRLRYANAALAEALVAAGHSLGRDDALGTGLAMLGWLLDFETASGHLSVTGAAGRGPDDRGPQFDQQSIEVAALADACKRAYEITNERRWLDGVDRAVRWFEGSNDSLLVMFDAVSGGGYDGLHSDRVNLNQGAESTLAYVSTMQHCRSLAVSC